MCNLENAVSMMEDFTQIYGMLEDQESKDIYLERLNYLISGDRQYIDNIVEKYLPSLHVWGRNIEKLNQSAVSKRYSSPVVFYGTGRDAEYISMLMTKVDFPFVFCDRDIAKQKSGFHGHKVISPEEMMANYCGAPIFVITRKFSSEIRQFLLSNGVPGDNIINMHNFFYERLTGYYFDMPFLDYGDHEVFVEAGSHNLWTTVLLSKYCPHLDRVFAFEPSPYSFKASEETKEKYDLSYVNLYPYATWSKKCTLKFDDTMGDGSRVKEDGGIQVQAVPIDDIVGDAKVTFIKMDVEGAELESLKGARNTIMNNKPKLAICIYHKPEDMLTLPLYIKSMEPSYKLYIRHLANVPDETVLFAV